MSEAVDKSKIKLAIDRVDLIFLISTLVLLTLHLIYLLVNPIPTGTLVPMKFDFSGRVTSYGESWTLWLLWASNIFVALTVSIVAMIPSIHNIPWALNAQNAPKLLRLSRRLCLFISAWISLAFFLTNYFVVTVALNPESSFPGSLISLILLGSLVPLVVFWFVGSRAAKTS